MLIGQYTSKLTDKKRLALPKKFRKELGVNIILAKWYEGCLVIVSEENWRDMMKSLTGKTGILTAPVRDIVRFIKGSAFEVSLDSQGRFVVPEILIVYAKIDNEVVFVGLEDKVEIWPIEKWIELEATAEEKANEAIEKIARREK